MSSKNYLDSLTNQQKNLCEYGGTFGILISLTCLVQHIIAAIPSKVTNPMIPAYFFAILAFLLLALQKTYSIILLLISAVFSMVIVVVWIRHYSFSLAVLLLFIYHVVIIIALFAEQVPKKLREKRQAEKAEEEIWAGKI